MTAVYVLTAWLALSVPVSIFIGRIIREGLR